MQSVPGFKDTRLIRRLAQISSAIAEHPSASFPTLFSSGDLEAAYRFFANSAVTPEAILESHVGDVCRNAADMDSVLVIHDSSTFAFNPDGAREGLGRVRRLGQAFYGHFSLVLADETTRRPLGVVAMKTWVRSDSTSAEHSRWFELVARSSDRLHGASPVHIMDREADDYALFAQLTAGSHRFIVRAMRNRMLPADDGRRRKLCDALDDVDCRIERDVPISLRGDARRSPKQRQVHPSRQSRLAHLAIGARTVKLECPRPRLRDSDERRRLKLPKVLSLNIVRIWEPMPPANESAVEWLLFTNDPIDSVENIIRIVDRYRARWTIEEFFKALKTGCAFEQRQLGDYEGLINALAVFVPIAIRLLWLRSKTQHAPDAPASEALSLEEIDILRVAGRVALPERPSARDALLAIAALGGHIKWNGEPGWLTLSRGLQKLSVLSKGWHCGKLQQFRDQS
jgi:Transposase DNA-binding/Transposase DDE domain